MTIDSISSDLAEIYAAAKSGHIKMAEDPGLLSRIGSGLSNAKEYLSRPFSANPTYASLKDVGRGFMGDLQNQWNTNPVFRHSVYGGLGGAGLAGLYSLMSGSQTPLQNLLLGGVLGAGTAGGISGFTTLLDSLKTDRELAAGKERLAAINNKALAADQRSKTLLGQYNKEKIVTDAQGKPVLNRDGTYQTTSDQSLAGYGALAAIAGGMGGQRVGKARMGPTVFAQGLRAGRPFAGVPGANEAQAGLDLLAQNAEAVKPEGIKQKIKSMLYGGPERQYMNEKAKRDAAAARAHVVDASGRAHSDYDAYVKAHPSAPEYERRLKITELGDKSPATSLFDSTVYNAEHGKIPLGFRQRVGNAMRTAPHAAAGAVALGLAPAAASWWMNRGADTNTNLEAMRTK